MMEMKNYTEALVLFDNLMKDEVFCGYAAVHMIRAQCLTHLSRNAEAIDDLRQCVKLAPWHADAIVFLSKEIAATNQFKESLRVSCVCACGEVCGKIQSCH